MPRAWCLGPVGVIGGTILNLGGAVRGWQNLESHFLLGLENTFSLIFSNFVMGFITYLYICFYFSCNCNFFLAFIFQEYWESFGDHQKCRRLRWHSQLCELIRARPSPAHPVLQPQRKSGHLPDQPTGDPIHIARTPVSTEWHTSTIPEYFNIKLSWELFSSLSACLDEANGLCRVFSQTSRLLLGGLQWLGFHDHPLLGWGPSWRMEPGDRERGWNQWLR